MNGRPALIIRVRLIISRVPITRGMSLRLRPAIIPHTTLLLKVAPALHGDLRTVEFTLCRTVTLVLLAGCLPGITPGEVVEFPERIGRQDEVPNWKRAQIDQHPEDVDETVGGDHDQDTWKAEDQSKQDQRNDLHWLADDGGDDDVNSEGDGGGENQSTDELDEDDKLHTEAECSAEIAHKYQFEQVVHSTVDPATTLGEQYHELVGDDSLANGLRDEDLLALGERLEHQCGEVSILTQEKQVLLVQGVNHVFRVMLDNVRVGQNGHPVVLTTLGSLDTVHRETTGQTSDTTEDGLERLGLVMRNEVSIREKYR